MKQRRLNISYGNEDTTWADNLQHCRRITEHPYPDPTQRLVYAHHLDHGTNDPGGADILARLDHATAHPTVQLLKARHLARMTQLNHLTPSTPQPSKWGFKGRTYHDRIMELAHRARTKHAERIPRTPTETLTWLELTGHGDSQLANTIRQDLGK